MSFDLNKVMLIGRVGRDPESKTAGTNTLSSFSVATSYGTGDKQKTEWHQVTAWKELGEFAQKYLHKGDKVYVEGRISYNIVGEGKEKKTYAQITATSLISLSPKPAGDAPAANSSSAPATAPAGASTDEDIPF
jgi:single-strand DNA-binding protein